MLKSNLAIFLLIFSAAMVIAQADTSKTLITGGNDSVEVRKGDKVYKFSYADIAAIYTQNGIDAAAAGEFSSAISEFETALLYTPGDPDLYYNIGLACYFLADYESSISNIDRAISLNEKNTGYYGQRGISYCMTGSFDKAISDFNKMLEIDPQSGDAYANLGAVYIMMENIPEACKNIAKAAALGNEKAMSLQDKYCR
ncbi:MAG: tetratricopeptide repeat protein [Bacteroidota bacterium]